MKIIYTAMISLVLMLAGYSCGGSSSSNGGGGGDTQTERLKITNNCGYTIWIAQQNMPSSTPATVKLENGESHEYEIPQAGIASTRFWAKKGCDDTGENCLWGQSTDPCPAQGCAPPVESKFEATWGCTIADQTQCGYTPQGDRMTDTYFDTSAVDGFTFPYSVTVSGNTRPMDGQPCQNIDCTNLDLSQCPTSEDLSAGQGGTDYPQYATEDLRVYNPSDNSLVGCYSPCKKLNYTATWGGVGLDEQTDPTVIYCCPTPPISTEECRAGPVVNTSYVNYIHNACTGGVYAYAYDDVAGLHRCSPGTLIHMTFGPNCP